MSIIKAVQAFLEGFDGMTIRPLSEVLTDMVGKSPSSYALSPAGNTKTGQDITGGKTYQNDYIFYARECADMEKDREENYVFLEALTDWLDAKNDAGELPALSEPYRATKLTVANALLFEIEDNGSATYQVQISLMYENNGGKNKWLT